MGGCATTERTNPRALAVTIAVTPVGARTVSAEQVAQIHQALKPELQRAGYVLADHSAMADLVLTVSFTPMPGGTGGRVKITGLEPTAQFRRETDGGDTEEAKELRRRLREIQRWAEGQSRNSDS
jgi:hypothetical protein